MKGCDGIGLVGVLLPQSCQLIAQHLKHQSRIQFRIVDMARLQTPVMIVLDQVVVGIARKCERIEP
ncbi:hypothetical protein ELI49_29400 (plasmid) [Rhizobium ruizarguesonis]|nr:hypothetical protein ELI49_29400 [Rhizobium ruizarguesonis]